MTLRLPRPAPKYDVQDQTEVRRLLESFAQRAALGDLAGGGGAGLKALRTVTTATASLATGEEATGSVDIGTRTAELLFITASRDCRLRLYSTNAAQVADQTRPIGTRPNAGRGTLGEFIWKATTPRTIDVSPDVLLKNGDSPRTSRVYYRIQNTGASGVVTLTLEVLQIEAT